MPLTKRQLKRLLADDLVPKDRTMPTIGRALEGWIKRRLFQWEQTAVLRQWEAYKNTYRYLRERALEAGKPDRAWVQQYMQNEVRPRLQGLGQQTALMAAEDAVTAWYAGYYMRLWQLDISTPRGLPINTPRPNVTLALRSLKEQGGPGWDAGVWAMLTRELGTDWWRDYGSEVDTVISQIERGLYAGVRAGKGMDDITTMIGERLGTNVDPKAGYKANFNRMQAITRTHVMNASNKGAMQGYRENTDVLSAAEHLTARDERVCFPAWTVVETETGPLPIQEVKEGMRVKTRNGIRTVLATSNRHYGGEMVRIRTKQGDIYATADHPFWVLEQGWLQGRNIKRGDRLQSVNNNPVDVIGVDNFILGNTAYIPTALLKVLSLACIPLRVLMPIRTIDLKGNAKIAQQKINTVASHLSLLNIFNAKCIKGNANSFFNSGFSIVSAITGERAKASISSTWNNTKAFTAIVARHIYRRATAFFGAVAPIKMRLGTKDFTAALAFNVFGISSPAFTTAYGISVRDGRFDAEVIPANWTYLSRILGRSISFIALTGTKTFTALGARALNFIGLAAAFTGRTEAQCTPTSIRTFTRAVNMLKRWRTSALELFSARIACKKHSLQLLTRITILYHRLSGNTITVYDLQVDQDHEFYANGVLVHNCDICRPMDGDLYDLSDPGELVPPMNTHVMCRCTVIPVIRDDYLSDLFLDEPMDLYSFDEWADLMMIGGLLASFMSMGNRKQERV